MNREKSGHKSKYFLSIKLKSILLLTLMSCYNFLNNYIDKKGVICMLETGIKAPVFTLPDQNGEMKKQMR